MLPDDELARLLGEGTPDHAAVTLISASLDAGSSDNVTVVVADLVDDDAVDDTGTSASAVTGPMLVGAAAEAPRRRGIGSGRSGRAADTGELEPVDDDNGRDGGDLDPEEMRYAPRPPRRFTWARRLAVLVVLAILIAIVAVAGYQWTQSQYYVANDSDRVAIFQGVEADVPGLNMHHVEEDSDLTLEELPTYNQRQVRDGISATSLEDARSIVSRLRRLALCPETDEPSPSPSASADPGSNASPSPNKPARRPSATPSPSASPSAPAAPDLCTEAP